MCWAIAKRGYNCLKLLSRTTHAIRDYVFVENPIVFIVPKMGRLWPLSFALISISCFQVASRPPQLMFPLAVCQHVSPRSGNKLIFFAFGKISLICLEGKSMIPHWGGHCSRTTLQSLMNAKLSQHRLWHCHESGLIRTIKTIPHNL